ncbi:tetratricopeptide repeat protein [Thermodesulfobacteriota bacterium]
MGKYFSSYPLYLKIILIIFLNIFLLYACSKEDAWNKLYGQCVTLYQQGKNSEATELAEEVLQLAEKTLGPEYPNMAKSLNNLAMMLLRVQGKTAEAEPFCKRILELMEKALGPDDPQVAIALNNLAVVYLIQGRHTEREPVQAFSGYN